MKAITASRALATRLVLVTVISFLSLPYFPDFYRQVGMLWTAMFIMSFVVTLYLWQKSIADGSIFSGICWSFWLVFMHIGPLVQIALQQFPWALAAPIRDLYSSIGVLSLSTFALAVGETYSRRKFASKYLVSHKRVEAHNEPFRRAQADDRLMVPISLVALFVALYPIFKLSIQVLFSTRFNLEGVSNAVFGDATTASLALGVPQSLTAVCTTYWILRLRQKKGSVIGRLLLVLLAPISLILTNPLTSARFWVWSVLGSYLMAYTAANKRLIRSVIAGFPALMVLIFPVLDYFRDSTFTAQRTSFGSLSSLGSNGDFDAFQTLSNVVYWVQVQGMQFGQQLLGVPFLFIPRSLWPSKPFPTGPYVAEQLGYPFTNLSSPLPAEGYADFGILGALSLCAIWGFVIAYFDYRIRQFQGDGRNVLTVAILFLVSFYQLILLRGSLIGTASRLFPMVLILMVSKLLRSRFHSRNERNAIDSTLETSVGGVDSHTITLR